MIIVETGAGVPDAENYISAVDAEVHHGVRAYPTWAPPATPSKEALRRRATEYMVGQ